MEHHSHCSDALKQKLTAIKKTIRNKFKSACAIRLECERDAGHAMKPLTASNSCMQQQSSVETSSKYRNIQTNDINYLCTRLNALLSSTKMKDDKQRIPEIKAIINRLRDLDIIV